MKYIEVSAAVRYWDDAEVNGEPDTESGDLIPCKDGELWRPVIRLEDGRIEGWPRGTTASIHYKVCDQGEYWLCDKPGSRVAKWRGDYAPDDFLCHGDRGYGDYIIFDVGPDGVISGWRIPVIDAGEWAPTHAHD